MSTASPRVPIALGSATSDTEEGRSFLQSRLKLFGGWVFLISGGFFIVGMPLRVAIEPVPFAAPFWVPSIFHLLGTFVPGGIWLVARGRSLSSAVLQVLDIGGVVLTCGCFSLMAGTLALSGLDVIEGPFHALSAGLLACTLVLLARAISVPCTPRRTVWVSAAAMLPMIAVGVFVASRTDSPTARKQDALLDLVAWSGAAVAVAATGSRVIFGLRAEMARIRTLGQYTLESKLGEGGMGVVYRARHALLRRPTAVKILPPERASDEDIRRFEREVQLTATLTHPSTVVIFDYGRTPEGVFYYAMELLDGITLERLVARDGAQPPGRVIHILRQVSGALAEAHAVGLIHRDVKPANIILTERGGMPDVAKVVDFGLVKHFSTATAETALNVTAANVVIGTPLYLSPEAIGGTVDARSDLYALGAVGYFLVTGQPLFEARNVVEMCGHHLHTTPTPPSRRTEQEVPDDLERIILKCLAKDPSDRYQSARALQDALAQSAWATPWPDEAAGRWWSVFRASQSRT